MATVLKITSAYKGALLQAIRRYEDGTFCDAPFAAYRNDDGTFYILKILGNVKVAEGLSSKDARKELRRLFSEIPVPPQPRIVSKGRRLIIQ